MGYKNCVIAYMDVLGFKKLIEDEQNINTAKWFIDDIYEYFKNLNKDAFVATQASDSLVLSIDCEQNIEDIAYLAACIQNFQAKALQDFGILVRGGITIGRLLHTGRYLFGPAMNAAVALGENIASYPRVIVDAKVFEYLQAQFNENEFAQSAYEKLFTYLVKDSDGYYYVDYIEHMCNEMSCVAGVKDSYMQALYSKISELEKSLNPSVIQKAGWLKDKYDKVK